MIQIVRAGEIQQRLGQLQEPGCIQLLHTSDPFVRERAAAADKLTQYQFQLSFFASFFASLLIPFSAPLFA